RHRLDLAPLGGGHRFQRMAERRAGARLDLDERDDAASARDEVDLLAAIAEVARQDAPARRLQQLGGEGLASASELVSRAPAMNIGAGRGNAIAGRVAALGGWDEPHFLRRERRHQLAADRPSDQPELRDEVLE